MMRPAIGSIRLAAALLLLCAPAYAGTRYVATDGVDTNDCLSAGAPCATMQHALDTCPVTESCGLMLAAGTYTQALNVYYRPEAVSIVGVGPIDCTSAPTATKIRGPAGGGPILWAQDHSILSIWNVDIGSDHAGGGIQSRQFSIVDIGCVTFSGIPGGVNIASVDHGMISCVAPTWITGSSVVHAMAVNLSLLHYGCSTYLAAGLSFAAFLQAAWLSEVDLNGIPFTGPGAGTGTTGQRCTIQDALIMLSGVTLPGTQPCYVADGGLLKN